ncbi:RNA-directed DNA polymerase, eukaryota, partial [Tanacetum coccineum]
LKQQFLSVWRMGDGDGDEDEDDNDNEMGFIKFLEFARVDGIHAYCLSVFNFNRRESELAIVLLVGVGEVIIMGDFNKVRCKSKRFGLNFNVQGANVFNSFIVNAGLEEIPLGGCSFTWCHKSATKMSKLDRFPFCESNDLLARNSTVTSLEVVLEHSSVKRSEVKREVWDCGNDKSPGPVRFQHLVYIHRLLEVD